MTITVEAPYHHSHHLCWSLVNKRVSWEQTTLCSAPEQRALSTDIKELPPGVYRLRSYLSATSHDGRHWRGGHDVAEGLVAGSDTEVLFTVDKLAWQVKARFDVLSQQRPLPAVYPGLPRLEALELSRHLAEDPLLAATLKVRRCLWVFVKPIHPYVMSSAANSTTNSNVINTSFFVTRFLRSSQALHVDGKVIVMMCNGGHKDMATNALYSLRRVGVPNILVFGLSPDVCSESAMLASYPCYSLPQVFLSKLCGDCTTRDVWSPGFADVAVIKPAVVLGERVRGAKDGGWGGGGARSEATKTATGASGENCAFSTRRFAPLH